MISKVYTYFFVVVSLAGVDVPPFFENGSTIGVTGVGFGDNCGYDGETEGEYESKMFIVL